MANSLCDRQQHHARVLSTQLQLSQTAAGGKAGKVVG